MPPDRALFARDYFPPRFKSCSPPLQLVLSHVPSLCLGLVAVFRSVSVLSHEFRQVFEACACVGSGVLLLSLAVLRGGASAQ